MNEVFGDMEFMAQFFACDEKEDMIKLCEERGISMTMEELDEILRCVLASVLQNCHRHIRILASDKVKYNLNFSR